MVSLAIAVAQSVAGLPDGFVDDARVIGRTGLNCPTQIVFLPDGRAIIAQRTGALHIGDPDVPGFPTNEYMRKWFASSLSASRLAHHRDRNSACHQVCLWSLPQIGPGPRSMLLRHRYLYWLESPFVSAPFFPRIQYRSTARRTMRPA